MSAPIRSQISTRDPELAAETIRQLYAEHTVRLPNPSERFSLDHSAVWAADLLMGRMRCTTPAELDLVPGSRMLYVEQVRAGQVDFGVRPGRDEPIMLPTDRWHGSWNEVDVVFIGLDEPAVTRYATATCGISPTTLRFTGQRPISPALAGYWRNTVTYVRDQVLDNPEASASPLILTSAFRQLAAALISTFPNTALAAITDPDAPLRDTVTEAGLRRAVAHLDSHPDQPVDLTELADTAGANLADLNRAFTARYGRTPRRHLTRARLDHAHHDLQAADPTTGDTVATIAARWGFANLTDFQIVYRAAYGHTPEHTLDS